MTYKLLARRAGLVAMLAAGAGAARAADAPATVAPRAGTVSELVVTAERPVEPGAVIGDIKAELQLTASDVASYGVSSISDLLAELAPQTRSVRGRGGGAGGGGGGGGPVVLLNGRRISGFGEIRDLPSEAIARVDVLPEEAALKYGFSADQRVINFVLKPRFRSETLEASGGGPTAGGQAGQSAELGIARIAGDNRLNLDLKVSRTAALTEAERNLTSLAAGQAFDLTGNVTAVSPGGDIDPALSALAGRPVTLAAVPALAAGAAPTLADFAATAGRSNATDVRGLRTLTPETGKVAVNGVFSRTIFANVAASVNATLEASSSDALRGLPGIVLAVPAGDPFSPFGTTVAANRLIDGFGPLRQQVDSWNGHLGVTLARDLTAWRLSLTGAYDHADTRSASDTGVDATALQSVLDTRTARVNPFGPLPATLLAPKPQSTGHSISDSGNLQVVASGPLLRIPAGPVRASVRIGVTDSALSSNSQRLGLTQSVDLSRNDVNLMANFDAPLASRRAGVLSGLGELSANANVAVDRLSDFGSLISLGYGLNWRPVAALSLVASRTHDEAAPTQQQLGAPAVLTPGVRIFDFATGRTVDVVQVDGGNARLLGDDRDVTSLKLNFKPYAARDLTFSANYLKSRIRNPIATFPAATADIEAAFPDRFLRNPRGELVQIDYRPVNFAREDRGELRWGVNYSRPIGPATAARGGPPGPSRPPGFGGAPDAGGPSGGSGSGGFAGGYPGGAGRGGAQDGRLRFSLYHTVILEDRVTVRPGGPVLDYLNGAAAGAFGGLPRHEIEAQAGIAERGFGASLSADWKSATSVRGGAGAASGDLAFSDIAKVNLRLFADLSQRKTLLEAAPWLRGARVSLSVSNLFDRRIAVHDASGATPLGYQPDYIDPSGRTIRLSFRKLFS